MECSAAHFEVYSGKLETSSLQQDGSITLSAITVTALVQQNVNVCAVFIYKIFAFIFVKSLKHFGFYFAHINGFCSAYYLLCSCFRIESEMWCFFFFLIYDFKMEEKKYSQCIRFFSTCYDAVRLWCLKKKLPTCFSGKNWNGRSMQKNAKG